LGAKTEKDAQYGPLFAGLLKILPTFLIVLPGTLAFVLFQDQIVDPNDTLPVLINELIPIGLKGVFAAALLAALMSTIAAALNSCSSLVAIDILQRIKPEVSDMQMVRVGKISAIVVMLLSIIWSTQAGKFDSIFQAINDLAAAIAPPISTVFLLGIFWRRGTKDAAFYTLIFGFFVGVGLFLLDFESISGEKYLTNIGIPFLMRTWWVFCLCCIFFIVVSLCTPPPPQSQVAITTWNGPKEIMKNKISGLNDPRSLAFILLLLMVVLYLFFG
jgi:SSS family solute:Na+ symporter